MFKERDSEIPEANQADLIAAGKELESIIDKFNKSLKISFKVIIEGRAARHLIYPTKDQNAQADKEGWSYAESLSYNRARNLFNLWKANRILSDVEKLNGEVFVSGSGFGGQGRYPNTPGQEELNKTFIIQIIPYIK
jgi:hypothetical protein